MKAFLLRVWYVPGLFFLSASFFNARAADTNPPPRLTVELRDGSRVVGTSLEKNFRFHSALLGEIKLDVKAIRSVECVSSNSAKLATANGDSLTVSFVDSDIAVKTGFGKVELAVDSVRKFSVSASGAAGAHPPGLVALWSGEGDAHDSIGSNNGALEGKVGFAPGKVGQAFSLNDEATDVKIPSSSALNVGIGDGFTLTAWINPSDVSQRSPIFEWNQNNGHNFGVHLYIDAHSGGPGTIYANVVDSDGGWHYFYSVPNVVIPNAFQFVALTYDKISGVAKIYYNGVMVAQQNLGSLSPQTSYDLYLGKRPQTLTDSILENYSYAGLLDEAAIYNRALSAAEIQTLCKEDNQGELPPPPKIPAVRPYNRSYRGGFSE
jgi:hypothetical protein